jgi:hypothetical protein
MAMSTFEQEDLWRSAKALASDKSTSTVLDRLEERYIDEWRQSDPEDLGGRDAAYFMVRAIAAFRGELNALASEPDITRFNNRLKRPN